MEDPTPEKIEEWIETMVPDFGCRCKKFARHHVNCYRPPYEGTREEWVEYTWNFHDLADQKTGDIRMTLEEARKIWL